MKQLALILALSLAAGADAYGQSATAQQASRPSRRGVFNPFAPVTSGRILAGRFGLPRFESALAYFSEQQKAAESSRLQPPPPAAAGPTAVVPTPIATSEPVVQSLISRPPYRPPVRSPYRPPPRPPF
ncbi:MAG: hypothetical protein IT424_12400 [Pirellulales bacterium]|nr:hypothetical protein [Pirellulales bacterium]